jgi:hypothetical protein
MVLAWISSFGFLWIMCWCCCVSSIGFQIHHMVKCQHNHKVPILQGGNLLCDKGDIALTN